MPPDPRPSDYDNDRDEPADDRDDPPGHSQSGDASGHPGRSPWMDAEEERVPSGDVGQPPSEEIDG